MKTRFILKEIMFGFLLIFSMADNYIASIS